MRSEAFAAEAPKTALDCLREEKAKEGWLFYGIAALTETKFSPQAKFEQIQVRTEEDIKTQAIKEAGQKDPTSEYEVDLVFYLNEKLRSVQRIMSEDEFRDIVENKLRPEDKNYYVFVRKKLVKQR